MQRGGGKGAEDRSVSFCPAPPAQMNMDDENEGNIPKNGPGGKLHVEEAKDFVSPQYLQQLVCH